MNLKTYDANHFTVISDKRFEALEAVAAAANQFMVSDSAWDYDTVKVKLTKLKETE